MNGSERSNKGAALNSPSRGPLSALRQFVRKNEPPQEACELCATRLFADHEHLLEPRARQILCACQACSILFTNNTEGAKYFRIPKRVRFLSDFQMNDALWDSLNIPIRMAFFFYSSQSKKMVAIYPSPAGPTESLLTLESWSEIEAQNPILSTLEKDVEALLVHRIGQEHQYFLAPIDECYKLVGLIRLHWRGLSGGTEVWRHVNDLFADLRNKAAPVGENANA
jgi:hypothetical protein